METLDMQEVGGSTLGVAAPRGILPTTSQGAGMDYVQEFWSFIGRAGLWLAANWIDILKAAAAPIIAIAALRVSRQQVEINASKLRLDLYDRRSEVYGAVKVLLGEFWADGTVTQEALDRFRSGTLQVDFLFDENVSLYIAEMGTKGQRLVHCTAAHFRGEHTAPNRKTPLQEMEALEAWFSEQGPAAKALFKPFLRLEPASPQSIFGRSRRAP